MIKIECSMCGSKNKFEPITAVNIVERKCRRCGNTLWTRENYG